MGNYPVDIPDLTGGMEEGRDRPASGSLLMCPCCEAPLRVSTEVLSALVRELRGYDPRFEGPEDLVKSLLDLLGSGLSCL